MRRPRKTKDTYKKNVSLAFAAALYGAAFFVSTTDPIK